MRLILRLFVIFLVSISASEASARTPDLYNETVVRDIKLFFTQPDWWDLLYQNYATETYIEADMEVDGTTYLQVGVRFKGYSSASVWPAEKMPFKVKTDEYISGQKLYGYDTINLGNSFMDPTFTREVVTYHILRKYMPAPKSNYVRLWLNNEYWGIYVNTEQVSGEFLGEWFEDTGGNRYKCDPEIPGPGSTLTWLGPDVTAYYDHYQLKSDPTGTEWQDLVDMIDVLNNRPVTVHWNELAPLLFIDRCLWYMAGCNLFCNLDSYIGSEHNYYVYNDPHEGRFNPITWDTNQSFGNFAGLPGGPPLTVPELQQLSPLLNFGNSSFPLITKLLDPSAGIRGRQVYLAHLRDMLLEDWDWSVIGALVQQYQDLIEQDVIDDAKKLYSLNYFYSNVTQDIVLYTSPFLQVSCGLQPFVENRRAYLLGLPIINAPNPQILNTSFSPQQPGPDDDVLVLSTVTVPGATLNGVALYFRAGAGELFQEVAMYDDGLHGDGAAGDDLFGGIIPAQNGGVTVEFFILAHTTTQTVSLDPIHGEHAPHSFQVQTGSGSIGVLINEFLAKNDTINQDEMGEYEDWIELYNETASSVDLSDVFLTDDLQDLTKWQFPSGTSIAPYGTLLIWTDNDPEDGPLHATFKLSADGEEVALVDTDGFTVLDSFVFGPQEADISTGRLFDGGEPWVTFLAPSPDLLNAPGTSGFRTYSALDSTAHTMELSGSGVPNINSTVVLQLRDSPVDDFVWFVASMNEGYLPYNSVAVLVEIPFTLVMVLPTDGTGALDLPVALPNDQALVGLAFYIQYLYKNGSNIQASNGLEMIIGQ